MKNMTALVSCYARAYHYKNNNEWVFKDNIADCILTNEEYNEISSNMKNGISYFAPEYNGKKEDELQFVVNNFLAPAVLARAVFCEKMLENAESFGCKSYAIFASGYDTYSLRKKSDSLKVFELDLPEMIEDKLKRIQINGLEVLSNTTYISCDLSKKTWKEQLIFHGFNEKLTAFGSLLGISYYLTKLEFKLLIESISELWCDGSSICFDYPAYGEGLENFKVEELANSAGEKMKAKYSYVEIEKLLSDYGFLIYEHHNHESATELFFKKYNEKNVDRNIFAPNDVNYCLAVKKR